MNMPWPHIAVYAIVINVATFAAFWQDKRAARQGLWRIPERTLLTLALLGGSPAVWLAGRIFRHKTRKTSFRVPFAIVVMMQITALLYCLAQQLYARQ
jgi:uncharacterized membrane protein YsdA (DUF1294 family)